MRTVPSVPVDDPEVEGTVTANITVDAKTRWPSDIVRAVFRDSTGRRTTWYTKNPRFTKDRVSFMRYDSAGSLFEKHKKLPEGGYSAEQFMFIGGASEVKFIELDIMPFYAELVPRRMGS